MSLVILADAINQIAPWIGTFDILAKVLAQQLGDDYLQRTEWNIHRLLTSKPMTKLLAERGIEISIDEDRRIRIRRVLL